MRSLVWSVAAMATYSGCLFGFSVYRILQAGFIDRPDGKMFGLSIIGTLFCLLIWKALHRRGLL